MRALQFERVAQLRVRVSDGTGVGSGYLIGDRLVLTAAHVVEDAGAAAGRAAVRFPAVDVEVAGDVVWSGTSVGLDAALVGLTGPVPGAGWGWRPVRWGRLTGHRPGVPASAVGFPRALRSQDGDRAPDQPSGTVNPGVAFGERYDLNVEPPHPLAEAGDPSPWSGLSGASLFSGQFLIGVVVIDTPRFRSGRLTSVPVWRLLADRDFTTVLAKHGVPSGWESVELAELFDRPSGRLDSPASLLRADNAVVRFRGRAPLLGELQGWCRRSSPLAFGLVTGPGGQGKTRLAWQLCASMRRSGWIVGFASTGPRATGAADRLADSQLPTLVVVDYAETWPDLGSLVAAAGEPTSSVRLLLLARSAGPWWRQLRGELRSRLGAPLEVSLPTLEDTLAGRVAAYADAVEDFASALPKLPGQAGTDWTARGAHLPPPDLSDPAFGAVLTVQLQALITLLSTDHRSAELHPDELEDILLEHEERYWAETAQRRAVTLQPETLRRVVGTATLCGAATEDVAVTTLTRLPGLNGRRSEDERLGVAAWVADLYPAQEGRYWGSLQPDRVGEHLVVGIAADRPDLVAKVLDGATRDQQYQALTVLNRAAEHRPELSTFLNDLLSSLPALGPVAEQVARQAYGPPGNPWIATLTFEEKNNHLVLKGKFKSGDVVGPTDVGDLNTIKDACHSAGKYLTEFASTLAEAACRPLQLGQLSAAFKFLFDVGCRLSLTLTGGDAELLARLHEAFARSWPAWRHPSPMVIPRVELVTTEATAEAATFPLELVPIFDFGAIPKLENSIVIAEVASRFLGLTVVISRVGPNADMTEQLLWNDPALPVRYVRRRSSTRSSQLEEEFLASLDRPGLVFLDGPHEVVALVDALSAAWPPSTDLDAALLDALLHDLGRPRDTGISAGPLLHLTGHWETNGQDYKDYFLTVSTKLKMSTRIPMTVDQTKVVFLNTCGSSTVDPQFALSFQRYLVPRGALVAPQAAIDEAAAADYAERFYRFLLGGCTLGEAVLVARRHLFEDTGSLLGLLHVQYGNDRIVVQHSHPEVIPGGHSVANTLTAFEYAGAVHELPLISDEVTRAVRDEILGPPLVNYRGWLGIDLVTDTGLPLEIREQDGSLKIVSVRHGDRYSLLLQIGDAVADARLTLPLRIGGGVDAEVVEFSVMVGGDEPELRQPPQVVAIATERGTARASFPLLSRWDKPTRIWLRVAQHERLIYNVELTLSPELDD